MSIPTEDVSKARQIEHIAALVAEVAELRKDKANLLNLLRWIESVTDGPDESYNVHRIWAAVTKALNLALGDPR